MALEPDPLFDPHDLKHKGEHTPKHAFVSEPYIHQEFPTLVYKDGATKSVCDEAELLAVDVEGWSKTPPPPVEVETVVKAVPVVVVDPAETPVQTADASYGALAAQPVAAEPVSIDE